MRNLGMGPPPIDRKRPRRGCFGCLLHMVWILLVGVAAAGVLYVGMQRVFYPWSFYLGGHGHWLPLWQGVGRMHTDHGDYTLYVYLEPARGGRTFNLPNFKGAGYLCTPRGERIRLFARAGMSEKTGIDSNGKMMSLRFYRHSLFGGINGDYEQPPKLYFRGKWQNPDLVMDDGGSLAAAFLPDGTVSKNPHKYYSKDATNKTPIVFHEVDGWQAWRDDCSTR